MFASIVFPLAPNCRSNPVTVCALEFGLVNVHVLPAGPETVKVRAAAGFTTMLALPVAVEPAELAAVTVQVAVPAMLVPTLILPLVPEPVADAPAPEQLTLAELAFTVDQLKVGALPAVT